MAAALGASAIAPLATASPAQAYCDTANKWPGSLVYTTAGGNVPAGWIPTLQTATQQWNGVAGANWQINYTSSSDVTFRIRYATPPVATGGGPAVTDTQWNAQGQIYSGEIYLDKDNWNWNLNGNFSQANKNADVRTTVVHELGHEIRLMHPNACLPPFTTTEQEAAMTPDMTKKWTINSDDKAGLALMK